MNTASERKLTLAPAPVKTNSALHIVEFPAQRRILAKHIIACVADLADITLHEIKGSTKVQHILYPRWVAMALIKNHCRWHTWASIARLFNKSDPKSIAYGVERAPAMMIRDPEMADLCLRVCERLGLGK